MKTKKFLEQERTGIVLIDMQPVLLKQAERKNTLIGNQLKLLKEYYNLPIIGVETNPNKNGRTKSKLRKIINVSNGTIIQKNKQSAFESPRFIEEVEKRKLKNLLINGIYSSCCIYKTAKDAISRGINVGINNALISDLKNIENKPRLYIERARESAKWYNTNAIIIR